MHFLTFYEPGMERDSDHEFQDYISRFTSGSGADAHTHLSYEEID